MRRRLLLPIAATGMVLLGASFGDSLRAGGGGMQSARTAAPTPAAAGTANVAAMMSRYCVGCHNPENSPHFDFALYLPQILGKGHGRK